MGGISKFILSSLLAISIFVSSTISLDPEIEATINELITQQFLPINGITGLGLSILAANDSMVRGYGFRNLEEQLHADSSTLFGIGSISKSFSSVLAVKILSEKYPDLGESVLDRPIRQLLPAINFTLIDRFRSESLSFRDLLSHRTCLLPENLALSSFPYNKSEFYYRHRYAPELCSFRTEFHYNNGAFGYVGELIASLAGSTLENLLEQLFGDLGMSETTYLKESVDYEKLPNMSQGYFRNGTRTVKYNSELLKRVTLAIGSGGILSSANDMLKYMQFHLNKGKVGNRQIISEEAMSWLKKVVMPLPFTGYKTSPSDPNKIISGSFGYALGLRVAIHDGWQRITHSGYIPPYLSLMSIVPALNLAIFSTTNGPGMLPPGADLDTLHAALFEILRSNGTLPISRKDVFKKLEIPRPKFPEIKVDARAKTLESHPTPQSIVGIYGNGLSGEFNISELPETGTTGEYSFQYGQWGLGILHPAVNASNTYSVEWSTDIVQDDYTYGPIDEIPPTILAFSQNFTKVALAVPGMSTVFEKDLTLDKLPVQPWDPTSCAPNVDLGLFKY
jgi:CubicO group peptidase (beta-lactamase class C family)